MTLWFSSSSRGTSSMATAPTSGDEHRRSQDLVVERVHVSCLSSLHREEGQGEGEHGGPAEQQGGVLLHPARLDHAEEAAGVLGSEAGAVDGAVHHALVDPPVEHSPATREPMPTAFTTPSITCWLNQ